MLRAKQQMSSMNCVETIIKSSPPALMYETRKEKRINTEKRNLNVLIILIQKQKRLFN